VGLLLGTQLYGWGQVYNARGQELADHYEEVLGSIAGMGMETVEASLDRSAREKVGEWAQMLRNHGLRPASMYSGGALHGAEPAAATIREVVAAGKAMAEAGFFVLNLNPDPIGREKTDEELEIQAEALERLGRELKGLGIALGLHNHTPEMVSEGREFHHNLRATDPGTVGLCLDVHWCYRGGADPYMIYEEYKDRIVSLHVRQSINGVWAEDFCEGDLDYRPLMRSLVERNFAGPVLIELALEEGTPQTRDVVENHRRSLEYLKSLIA